MLDSVVTLPFNQHVGIQESQSNGGLLELPAGEQYLNHIGTVHAGAQLALAEACSGEFLLKSTLNLPGIFPVVRRVEAKFKKPARGRMTASASTALDVIDVAHREIASKGRCLLSIVVNLYDEQGEHALASCFEWFIAKTNNGSEQK